MKKVIIPTILAATILVAGIFAMMPVQKASTIHSSLGLGGDAAAAADVALGAAVDIVADSATVKSGVVCADVDNGADDDVNDVLVEIDAAGAETVVLIADPDTAGLCGEFTGFRVFLAATDADDDVTYSAKWTAITP